MIHAVEIAARTVVHDNDLVRVTQLKPIEATQDLSELGV
jgi:hypothetical protein